MCYRESYVLGIADVGSRHKYDTCLYIYGKTVDEGFVISSIQRVVTYLRCTGKTLKHYHADGGKELLISSVRSTELPSIHRSHLDIQFSQHPRGYSISRTTMAGY